MSEYLVWKSQNYEVYYDYIGGHGGDITGYIIKCTVLNEFILGLDGDLWYCYAIDQAKSKIKQLTAKINKETEKALCGKR